MNVPATGIQYCYSQFYQSVTFKSLYLQLWYYFSVRNIPWLEHSIWWWQIRNDLLRADHPSNRKQWGVCVYYKSSLPLKPFGICCLKIWLFLISSGCKFIQLFKKGIIFLHENTHHTIAYQNNYFFLDICDLDIGWSLQLY